jgi:Flp pilus assembly protein TadD
MAAVEYDVFLSHAWADGERPQHIADALTKAGLRVWFDAVEINDFASITRTVAAGLAKSKALVAYYSHTYPLRRACQWELTAAYLAGQAEGDPRQRVMVINPEKGIDHIHPVELRDAKFRNAPNADSGMAQLVDGIVKHLAPVRGPLADIHPLSAPNWYGMTPVGSTRFVGRLKEMWSIHSLLHAGDVAQVTGVAAATGGIGHVRGLAGVGKSLLAEEYALRFGAAYPGGIFWLRAYGNDDTKEALGAAEREALRTDQIAQIAERLGIRIDGLKAAEIEGELGRKLASAGKPCLWVVDDVPNGMNGEDLRRWLAPHALARTLITTRSREYGSLAREIDLSVLTPDEAFQLLTSRKKPKDNDEEEQARGLARDLGYHALALDVTASALQSYGSDRPYHAFRDELKNPDDDALELAAELANALPNGHEASIAKTILRSIRTLGPEGQDLLRLATALAVAPISGPLVTEVFEEADGLAHSEAEQRQRKAFHQVTKASLAETAGDNQEARSVHTLVSRAMRLHERSAPERTRTFGTTAVKVLTERIERIRHIGEYSKIAMDVPHARQLVANDLQTDEQALLALWVARRYYERADYGSARRLQEQVVAGLRRVRGKKHADTLTAMGNLAETLKAQGDLAGARKLMEQVLAASRRLLGEEHADTLTAMDNLARTLNAQGDLAGASKLQKQVLAASRRVLGEEHPETLTTMNNLARTLYEQGDLGGARKLQKQVQAGRHRVLGEEHPDTLTAMDNLALTLCAQGNLTGARKLQRQVLAASRRVLGEEHPNTLTAMDNLAATLYAQDDLAGARKLQEQVLEATRRVLGEEHPSTLTTMNNLAATLYTQDDLGGARRLAEQVLEASRRVLGKEHPATLTRMNNLAKTMKAQGDPAGAKQLQKQALAARRRVLGKEHPDTLTAMNDLAQTLYEQGDLEGTRKLEEQVLLMLGDKHPSTLTAMNNLARTLYAQRNLEGANKLQQQVLARLRRVLGEVHPDTLTATNNLAETLCAQGDLAGARKLLKHAMTTLRRVLGEEHPDTLIAMNNLALTLYAQGDLAGARKLQEQVVAGRRLVLGEEHPDTLTARNNLAEMTRNREPQ